MCLHQNTVRKVDAYDNMDVETLQVLSSMSKAEILRVIITEKLTTAAQEIFAVVERTVAGYEEEVSGLRQETERQRRQLEVVLQPQVKLERRDDLEVFAVYEGKERPGAGGGEVPAEEEQQLHMEATSSCDDEEEKSEHEDELPAVSQEHLKDPDYVKPLRVQSERTDERRLQNRLHLRVRLLGDSQSDIITAKVLRRCTLQDLKCPRGLREADFLDLLRSAFPQLSGDDKPFDIFTASKKKKLEPLRVKTLTPEEIYRTIRRTGSGRSSLYIRMRTGDNHQTAVKDLQVSPSTFTATTSDETRPHARVQSERTDERRLQNRLHLRVRLLGDSQSDIITAKVLRRCTLQDLKCPRGLREADFLDLLRSAFPQLSGDDKPFDIFTASKKKKLEPLRVKTLTPEEIYRTIRRTGSGRSSLYIRMKTGDNHQTAVKDLQVSPSTFTATTSDETRPHASSPTQQGEGNSCSIEQHEEMETEESDDDQDPGVPPPTDDGQISSSDDSEAQRERVEGDDGEINDRDDEWKPDENDEEVQERKPEPNSSKTTRKWRVKHSNVQTKRRKSSQSSPKVSTGNRDAVVSCKVCGSLHGSAKILIRHSWSHVDDPEGLCGVCGENLESAEELRRHLQSHQKTHICNICGRFFLTTSGLNRHIFAHKGEKPYKCDICNKAYTNSSALRNHHWEHVEDKPLKCDMCPKSFGLKMELKNHRKIHTGEKPYSCNVCSKAFRDLIVLSRHRFSHSDKRQFECQVCQKTFKLYKNLRQHEKIHTVRDKPYLCDVCSKAFHTQNALNIHMKTHSGQSSHLCSKCGRGFFSNGALSKHMRSHTEERPYSCSECGQLFKCQYNITRHMRIHSGEKPFVCGICGKACAQKTYLTVHMRIHNGERPYKCTICAKAFTQSHCLKKHMNSHQRKEKS